MAKVKIDGNVVDTKDVLEIKMIYTDRVQYKVTYRVVSEDLPFPVNATTIMEAHEARALEQKVRGIKK